MKFSCDAQVAELGVEYFHYFECLYSLCWIADHDGIHLQQDNETLIGFWTTNHALVLCKMFLESIFYLIVGLAVGAYNKESMKDCLDDTFHLGKQQSMKMKEKAAPMAKQVYQNAGPKITGAYQQAREQAAPYLTKVQKKT